MLFNYQFMLVWLNSYLNLQVQSFDEGADDDEELIITTSCMRALMKLAGVTLGKRYSTNYIKIIFKLKTYPLVTRQFVFAA